MTLQVGVVGTLNRSFRSQSSFAITAANLKGRGVPRKVFPFQDNS